MFVLARTLAYACMHACTHAHEREHVLVDTAQAHTHTHEWHTHTQLDAEIARLDDPSAADIAAIRRKRMDDMKKRQVGVWLLGARRRESRGGSGEGSSVTDANSFPSLLHSTTGQEQGVAGAWARGVYRDLQRGGLLQGDEGENGCVERDTQRGCKHAASSDTARSPHPTPSHTQFYVCWHARRARSV